MATETELLQQDSHYNLLPTYEGKKLLYLNIYKIYTNHSEPSLLTFHTIQYILDLSRRDHLKYAMS